MHLIESFPSNCMPTADTDYVVYMNITLVVMYFFIFIISNIVIRCSFQVENQEAFGDCLKIKSMTVGFLFLVGCASVIFISGLKSPNQAELVHCQINIFGVSSLIMYIIKEREYTFPILWSLIPHRMNNVAIPALQPASSLPMQQLNPAALNHLEELPPGVRRVTEWVDDGGIFVG